jgi:hypothetical protein
MERRRPATQDGVAGPNQEWNAARRPVESRCGGRPGGTARQASAVLLYLTRQAHPLGADEYGLEKRDEEAGLKDVRFHDLRHYAEFRIMPISALAPNVGLLASAIWYPDTRVAAARRLALVGDGRTLCPSRARSSRVSCQSARLAARWLRSGYIRATLDARTSH